MKEVELAKKVIQWLDDQGWTVYQEVQLRYGGPVADIVAVSREDSNRPAGLVWVVECKVNWGLGVIDQALRWRNRAHLISVAINMPTVKSSIHNWASRTILEASGLGVIGVSCYSVETHRQPSFIRNSTRERRNVHRSAKELRDSLLPEHRTFASAGNADSKRLTLFQKTKRIVIWYVKEHPGCTLKELIAGIDHHYSSDQSAKTSLVKWIDRGIIDGIKVKRNGKIVRLTPC